MPGSIFEQFLHFLGSIFARIKPVRMMLLQIFDLLLFSVIQTRKRLRFSALALLGVSVFVEGFKIIFVLLSFDCYLLLHRLRTVSLKSIAHILGY